jgi:N4-gp56 family major capsid protein
MSINAFPDSIKAIIQNGILERTFQEALTPEFLYRQLATPRPFQSNLGETVIFTRTGLLAPVNTPLAPGTDPTPQNYSIEQYSMTLSQYGNAMDTNMLTSAIALASKFLEDNTKLAINAGQSLNTICRDKLYSAYLSGNTFAVGGASTSSTSLVVNDTNGFGTVMVNGQQVAVSANNPLQITINGAANTVTAVNTSTNTLTLGTSATWADGDPVIAANAPRILRPNAKTTYNKLASSDVASLSVFLDAVAYLRQNNVPTIGGYYVAHVDAVTERQLYADADFKQAMIGRVDSPIYRDLSIGRFAGIDWVRNTQAPTITNSAGITVRRPIVVGSDALIEGPLEGFGNLLGGTGIPNASSPGIVTMVNGIAVIHRPPLDRLQQIISSAWSWVGDYAVPTDSLTGTAAQYKRAVVIEHAG